MEKKAEAQCKQSEIVESDAYVCKDVTFPVKGQNIDDKISKSGGSSGIISQSKKRPENVLIFKDIPPACTTSEIQKPIRTLLQKGEYISKKTKQSRQLEANERHEPVPTTSASGEKAKKKAKIPGKNIILSKEGEDFRCPPTVYPSISNKNAKETGINIYMEKCITDFKEAASILLSRDEMPNHLVCKTVPEKAPLESREVTFLVDLLALETAKRIYMDNHGNWGKGFKTTAYYVYENDESAERIDHRDKKKAPEIYDAKIIKLRFTHPNTEKMLSKHIFIVRDFSGKLERYASIGYKWEESIVPFEFSPAKECSLDEIEMPDDFKVSPYAPEVAAPGFGSGVKIYTDKAILDFPTAAEIITEEKLSDNRVCISVPQGVPTDRNQVTFVVDLTVLPTPAAILDDGMGDWGKDNGDRGYYNFSEAGLKKSSQAFDGEGRKQYDVKVIKQRFRHPNSNEKLMKHIYTAKNSEDSWFRYALVSYKWFCKPHPVKPTKFKEQKKTFYIRRKQGIENKITRVLTEDMQITILKRLRGDFFEYDGEEIEGELYLDNIEPFGSVAISEFSNAVDVLLRLDNSVIPICVGNAPEAPLTFMEMTYVLDLKSLENPEFAFVDGNGSWGKVKEEYMYYSVRRDSIEELGKMGNVEFNAKITKSSWTHPHSNGLLKKFMFTCQNKKGKKLCKAIVSYQWTGTPFPVSHGGDIKSLSEPIVISEPYKKRPRLIQNKISLLSGEEAYVLDEPEMNDEFDSEEIVDDIVLSESEDEYNDEPQCSGTRYIIHPEETFPPGVIPYSADVTNKMAEAAEILLKREPPGPVCSQTPHSAPQKMRKITYIVDMQALEDPKDIFVDLHGAWGRCSGQNAFYRYTNNGVVKVDANGRRNVTDADYDVKLTKQRHLHEAAARKLRKYIFVAYSPNRDYLRWGLVSYQWHCEPFSFKPKPHGNCTRNFRPYQPTKFSVRNRIKELSLFYTPEQAVSEFLTEKVNTFESIESAPQAHEIPRDSKQAANTGKLSRNMHRAAYELSEKAKTLIRQFPKNKNAFSVMDETMGETVNSYVVLRNQPGEYKCNCPEFSECNICRHTLAIARLHEENELFIYEDLSHTLE